MALKEVKGYAYVYECKVISMLRCLYEVIVDGDSVRWSLDAAKLNLIIHGDVYEVYGCLEMAFGG